MASTKLRRVAEEHHLPRWDDNLAPRTAGDMRDVTSRIRKTPQDATVEVGPPVVPLGQDTS